MLHPEPRQRDRDRTVLEYTTRRPRPPGEALDLLPIASFAITVLMTIATCIIGMMSSHDADPFAPSFDQAFVYLGIASALIALWIAWTAWLVVSLARRSVEAGPGTLMTAAVAWCGLLSLALHSNAAEYVDQTKRIRGARWPAVVEWVFRA